MNIEKITYAMAGAVFVIHPDLPQRCPADHIQIITRASFQKSGMGQIQITS